MLSNKGFRFIVQYFALIYDYSIYENVVVPLEYTKISRKAKKEKILKMLKSLCIEDKIDKTPKELSEGQCQRVAIDRALIKDPEVILAVEPTGALGKKTYYEIMKILKEPNNQGKTIIINLPQSLLKSIYILALSLTKVINFELIPFSPTNCKLYFTLKIIFLSV